MNHEMPKLLKRGRFLLALCLLLVVSVVAVAGGLVGAAADPGSVWAHRDPYTGYFTSNHSETWCSRFPSECKGTDENDVLPPGSSCGGSQALPYSCVHTIDQFITQLRQDSNSKNGRIHSSAAFIFWTLLGKDGDYADSHGGRDVSGVDLSKVGFPGVSSTGWTALDNLLTKEVSDKQIRIDFRRDNVPTSYIRTYAVVGNSDKGDVTYCPVAETTGCPGGPQTGQAITITNHAGTKKYYELFRDCANPSGGLQGLPPLDQWKLTGTSSVNVATARPGDTVDFAHSITNARGSTTASFSWRIMKAFGKPTVPAFGAYSNFSPSFDDSLPGGRTRTITHWNSAYRPYTRYRIPSSARVGDYYCELVYFTRANGPGTGPGHSEGACVRVIGILTTPTCAYPPSFSVSPVDPRARFRVTVSISYPPGTNMSSVVSTHKMDVEVRGPQPGNTFDRHSDGLALTASGNDAQATTGLIGPIRNTGTFEVVWQTEPSSLSPPCSFTFIVANAPYFAVNGGDVQVGDCMETGPSTSIDNDAAASVVGWNRENSAGGFAGAGVQYAALALGYLQDFATDQGNTTSASKLGFANTGLLDDSYLSGPGTGTDTYGGGFGGYQSCVPDYYGTPPSSQVKPDGYTQPATPVSNGTHTTIYVNGNAFINGDIIYTGSGSYANVSDIPSFTLIAKGGNIYIEPGVTQLDGLYVAEPDSSGNGGTIYTCTTVPDTQVANGDSNLTVSRASYYDTCGQHLTINGAFIAQAVELLRTTGTLYASPTNPAETFNFNPELWLGSANSANTLGDSADSITDLPPIF